MTLQEAIEEVKRARAAGGEGWQDFEFTYPGYSGSTPKALATVANAVASGDLIPKADADLAVAEALRKAGEVVEEHFPGTLYASNRTKVIADINRIANQDHLAEVTALRAERDELQQVFDQQWAADQRAISEWQKANPGNDLVRPDSVRLSAWALAERMIAVARAEAAEAEVTALRAGLEATHRLLMVEADASLERLARAEAAEAEVARLLHEIHEASHPDFLFGAMDNVNDMDVSLDDFARAASRAIRAALTRKGEPT